MSKSSQIEQLVNFSYRFEDMYCVSNIPLLCDLTLEGCPLTAFPNYRHLILFNIPQLKVLDTRRALVYPITNTFNPEMLQCRIIKTLNVSFYMY